jgi:hypothetical protein
MRISGMAANGHFVSGNSPCGYSDMITIVATEYQQANSPNKTITKVRGQRSMYSIAYILSDAK